jgi:hypothetical protein
MTKLALCIGIVELVVEALSRSAIIPSLEIKSAPAIENVVEDHASKSGVACSARISFLSHQEDAKSVFEAAKGSFNNHPGRRVDEVEVFILGSCNGWIWREDTNLSWITSITNEVRPSWYHPR